MNAICAHNKQRGRKKLFLRKCKQKTCFKIHTLHLLGFLSREKWKSNERE